MQNPQPGPPPARVAAGELAVVAAVALAAVWGGTRAGVGLVATIVVTLAATAAALSRLWGPRGAGRPVARPVAQPVSDDGNEGAAVGTDEARGIGDGDVARTADGTDGTDVLAASHAQDAQNGFAGIARRLQAAVNQQLLSLRDMQTRHGDQPEVFSDLLHLDHGVSLIGRLADSLAVLGGVRQGRQWDEPVPLIGVVRGAMSRIVDYRRVDVDGLLEALAAGAFDPAGAGGATGDGPAFDEPDTSGPAVRAMTVEPVVHALAELLDNATRYSPPDTRVAVTAHRIGDGLVVSVADAGVGLTPAALRQAALALASSDSGLMRASGGAPRLGLTVVGRLAAAHGFQVTLEPGAGGGATARVYLPGSLLTVVADGPDAADASGGVADPAAGPPVRRRSAAAAEPPTIGAGGLPQRRRWSPGTEVEAVAVAVVNGGASYGTVLNGTSHGTANSAVNGGTHGAHGGTANGTTPHQSQDPYDQAGLWLGAFRAGEDGQRS